MEKGDYDEDNNLINLHPYCLFCCEYFFNEDMFTSHLKTEHMKCHLCTDEKYKWHYYCNYESLNIHFKSSHFICKERDCIEKCFIAFRTQDDLEKHMHEVHKHPKKKLYLLIDTYEKPPEIQDKEGNNFSVQVILIVVITS